MQNSRKCKLNNFLAETEHGGVFLILVPLCLLLV